MSMVLSRFSSTHPRNSKSSEMVNALVTFTLPRQPISFPCWKRPYQMPNSQDRNAFSRAERNRRARFAVDSTSAQLCGGADFGQLLCVYSVGLRGWPKPLTLKR